MEKRKQKKTGDESGQAASRVRREVRRTIQQYDLIQKGDHIIIGLSGGPDSVCLFALLQELSEEYELALHPVHINHQLRGKAADEDQAYVERICEAAGRPCTVVCRDVNGLASKWGVGTEEAGRRVRYQAFERERERLAQSGPVKIAVAQNRNDQAETVLMRLIRGTGPDGLSGMEPISGGVLIRPLLFVDRNEIEAFCLETGWNPRIDQTNLEPVYVRNRIRLELIPMLKQYNEGITDALNRLARIAKEDRDYFRAEAKDFLQEYGKKGTDQENRPFWEVSLKALNRQLPALQKRIVLFVLEELGLEQDVGAVHLEQAAAVLLREKMSAVSEFPGGYRLRISYGTAVFEQAAVKSKEEHFEPMELCAGEKKLRILCRSDLIEGFSGKIVEAAGWPEETQERDGQKRVAGCGLDAERLCALCGELPLCFRTRRAGDRIHLSGMQGSVKIQNFFVNRKVPGPMRDRIPLLCLGSEVLWIAGFRAGRDCERKDGTQMILLLEYKMET